MRFSNPARPKRNLPRLNCLRRAAGDESGVTAIEFALVLGPFLALLFGIMSVGFYFFSLFSLEHAIEDASRQIRIGTAQSANKTDIQFKADVCAKLPAYMVCTGADDKIRLNVQNSTNYTVASASCLNSGSLITSGTYAPGAANDVVIVTICFEWNLGALPNMIYWLSPSNARMGNGSLLLSASTVFTNEP